MKTSLVAIVLALAAVASGQGTAPQPQAQPAAPQAQPAAPAAAPAAPQSQAPVIKDPAEYNAYVGAVQQPDAAAKISGLEAFVAQYPNSVVKQDALDLLMGTYQQAGNQAKVIDTANRLLAVNPDSAKALVLLAYNERASQKWADAKQHAERGLQALPKMPKPEGMTDPAFTAQKAQFAALLNSVAGFSALQLKDYPAAQKYLRPAVEADPKNVENVYPLALAYLTATPPDDVNGLFFITLAANLVSDPKGKDSIIKFGRSRYVKYHGSEQGWDDLMTLTKTTMLPPAGFAISQYVPPTPAEQAHDLVKDKTAADIKKLSFAEWELVLSAGGQEDADKVWNVIKGVALQMEATLIAGTATELQIAASQDDIDQKRADIVLSFPAPLPAKLIPAPGATVDFEGTPVSYTPTPFVMTMEKGALLTKAPPPAPKKPPVRRKPH
jgi:tetratricopeptide (TPR) repeat protein